MVVRAASRPELIGCRQPLFKGSVAAWVTQRRQPLYIPDIVTDPRFNQSAVDGQYRKNSLLSAPIIHKSKVVGVINATDKIGERDLLKQDINRLLNFKKMNHLDPKKMNFLIVDDAQNMRRSIRAMLKLLNYGKNFYEASDGQEAWQLLRDENITIDFVISDYRMPHTSGTELLNMIRHNRRIRDTPFLMITAEANMDVVAEAAELDVDAYLTKPFTTNILERKIAELLERIRNPTPLTVHLNRSRELEEKGDLDGAIIEAQKSADLDSRSSRPWRELGRLITQKGDLAKAQSCFEQAVRHSRLDVGSYHALGQIAFRLNNHKKAFGYFPGPRRSAPVIPPGPYSLPSYC